MLVEEQGFEPWAFRMQSGRSATELHPLCIQDAVKRAGLMNPKPRSFQRQAVPVTRSPVPSPILPRVGDRLGPRRGERCACRGGAAASAFACCRYSSSS